MSIILQKARNLKRLRILSIVLVSAVFWIWELLEHFVIPEPSITVFLIELATVTLLISILLYFLFSELIKVFSNLDKSNQELFFLKNYQESILESSPHAIVAFDKKGLITSFNAQARTISGYTATDAIGMDILSLFIDKIKIQETLKTAQSVNGVETIKETELISIAGVQIPVLLLIRSITNKDNHDEGFVMILEDLREKKRLEKRLILSEKMAAVSQLTAGLAHEIRNPLASIAVNLRNLEDLYRSSNESTREHEIYFDMISSDVERLNKLLGKFVRSVVPKEIKANSFLYKLDQVLDDVLQKFKRSFKSRKICLRTDFPSGSIYIKCAREQLIQAFSNIVQNSVEAMPVSGKLSIEIKAEGEWSQVKICDTGCGISPENLKHIFDFYFTSRAGGLGIGLPFASLIIEQHGGKIEVESEPDKGTCVIVRLPVKETKSDEQQ